jgi:hypothetical protein
VMTFTAQRRDRLTIDRSQRKIGLSLEARTAYHELIVYTANAAASEAEAISDRQSRVMQGLTLCSNLDSSGLSGMFPRVFPRVFLRVFLRVFPRVFPRVFQECFKTSLSSLCDRKIRPGIAVHSLLCAMG